MSSVRVFLTGGSGVRPTPLVFLHGLGTGPEGFEPQRDELGRDRATAAPTLPLDFECALSALTAAARDLDAGRVDLCGLSFGGLVALSYAARHPGRVRRLVVAAAFARLPLRLRALQLGLATAASAIPAKLLVRGLTAELPEPHRAAARRSLADVRPGQVAGLMRAGARFELDPRAVPHSTLVICGERDRLNLPLSHELAGALPDGELRVLAGAGHVVNLDRPVEFTRAVRQFLDRG